jgi:hypothetical protein
MDNLGKQFMEYVVLDLAGKQWLRGNMGKEFMKIDISSLTNGMYFLQLHGNKGAFTIKFIKI